ncbi:RagB/SusD family nutrient uptake outer membrane protein [Albibacterium profundi]|uniref:RagB/SusD family nutrient uptake outer membrane protein n=1 Tax=Albibacterium profundi TaxID=3134906 RepID=A0ABV5C9W8_9SPHI
MKTYIKKFSLLTAGLLLAFSQSCTKFDDKMYSAYTEDNFPKTPAQFVALTGPVYTAARGYFGDYFDLQTAGSDEVVIPTRGGDWFDGGKWRDMHFHTWSSSHEVVGNAWNWGFNAIGTCNRILSIFEQTEESDLKTQTMAEIKTMRAWYYYLMMDAYGNLPLVTTFDDRADLPETQSRADIYNFIATELEENLQYLSEEKSEQTYARPTKWMAHTLLAKLYLNAEVYTGTPQWDKVVTHANAVIESGRYSLESDYFAQFMPDNGPANTEPIFSIPFDPARATGNQLFNKVLHYGHRLTYGLSVNTWNGWSAQPAYFDLFDEDDYRTKQWLYGQQYDATGQPLVFNGVNVILDPYGYELVDGSEFDIGGDDNIGRLAGARNVKYYPDKNQVSNNAGNDVVVYRLADVYLMKAEAILRGAGNGTVTEAVDLVNQIRARAFPGDASELYTAASLNLDAIYTERALELTFEVTRRTDMIRFEHWEDAMLFKPANPSETYKRIFPVPQDALNTNENLDPNPGYTN